MMTGDELNAALEEAEQSVLRKLAQQNARDGGPKQYYGPDDHFDKIGGAMVVRRCHHAAIIQPKDGEYGG